MHILLVQSVAQEMIVAVFTTFKMSDLLWTAVTVLCCILLAWCVQSLQVTVARVCSGGSKGV